MATFPAASAADDDLPRVGAVHLGQRPTTTIFTRVRAVWRNVDSAGLEALGDEPSPEGSVRTSSKCLLPEPDARPCGKHLVAAARRRDGAAGTRSDRDGIRGARRRTEEDRSGPPRDRRAPLRLRRAAALRSPIRCSSSARASPARRERSGISLAPLDPERLAKELLDDVAVRWPGAGAGRRAAVRAPSKPCFRPSRGGAPRTKAPAAVMNRGRDVPLPSPARRSGRRRGRGRLAPETRQDRSRRASCLPTEEPGGNETRTAPTVTTTAARPLCIAPLFARNAFGHLGAPLRARTPVSAPGADARGDARSRARRASP